MSRYGMPYKGNKSKIVDRLIEVLPPAENFYDLFMGGGAVTHRALLTTGKWKNFICNDLNPLVVKAWNMAIKGEFKNEKRWISREDFKRLKDTDPYVAICFSFGNDLRSYAYDKDIECYKRAMHKAIMDSDYQPMLDLGVDLSGITGDLTQRRLMAIDLAVKTLENAKDDNRIQHFERLQSLVALQSMQRLESMQRDYRNVPIKANSVIYCDIPYEGTNEYKTVAKFDTTAFYDWCEKQSEPVFVSSYNLPKEKFDCIAEWDVTCQLSATNNAQQVTERLFVPKHQQERGNVGLFGGLYVD